MDADFPPPTPAPTTENNDIPNESLLDRIKAKIPDTTNLARLALIPGAIVLAVLFVGVGGTYLVASSFLASPSSSESTSRISQNDLANSEIITPPPIDTPVPATPTPTAIPTLAVPTPTPPLGWTSYSFSALNLTFSYPPGWFVNVPATSGAPYLYVQNFSGNIPFGYSPNQFAILIGRLEQVGITTVSALTTQLALNAASSVYINGVNMGQVSVITSAPITVNGYSALQRTVSYSASPSAQMTEVYVLDGVSNVVEFVPLLDTTYGQSYFNDLLSTVEFTN